MGGKGKKSKDSYNNKKRGTPAVNQRQYKTQQRDVCFDQGESLPTYKEPSGTDEFCMIIRLKI